MTKSTLILRDLDLLAELATHARIRIYFTITTLERDLWRRIEPGTPPPAKRLLAMQRLTEAGVPCGVMMAPVLPGITDSLASIESVAAASREHGATAFHPAPLRLAPLVKEHYFDFVESHFPELLPNYQRAYLGQKASPAYVERLTARIQDVRERYDFIDEEREDRYKLVPVERSNVSAPNGQLALPI